MNSAKRYSYKVAGGWENDYPKVPGAQEKAVTKDSLFLSRVIPYNLCGEPEES